MHQKGIELRTSTEEEHHDHGDGHKEDEHHHDKRSTHLVRPYSSNETGRKN